MNSEHNLFLDSDSPLAEFLDPSISSFLGEDLTSLENKSHDAAYQDVLISKDKSSSPIEELTAQIEQEREAESDASEVKFFEFDPFSLKSANYNSSQADIDTFTGAELAENEVFSEEDSTQSLAVEVEDNSELSLEFNSQGIISVPQGKGENATVTLTVVSRRASYQNETGLFLADDATGSIGDLAPGAPGYAKAALSEDRRLMILSSDSESVTVEIPQGAFIGSYLIQNSTTAAFLANNPDNQLDQKPLAFFSFAEINPDGIIHLSSSESSDSLQLAWEDLTGGGDADYNDLVVELSFAEPLTIPTVNKDNFAVYAEGTLILNQESDFDGEPIDLGDDALIYAKDGFFFNREQTLPVELDENGNPLLDENNQQTLVDNAVTVSEDYIFANARKSQDKYNNLIPPQIVQTQPLELPDYQQLKQQQLDTYLNDDATVIDFDIRKNRINNAKQWQNKFPAPGTIHNPTIVKVTNGKLTIPNGVDLENYVIVVEDGDIQFNGTQQNLDNVVLMAEAGKIDLKRLNANNATILAADKIKIHNNTHFTGDNLIANGSGDIELKNSTTAIGDIDKLTIYAADDLKLQRVAQAQGEFFAADGIDVRGDATLYGKLAAKGDIKILGKAEIIAIPEPEVELPSVSLGSSTAGESDTSATVTISLSAPSDIPVTVDYTTVDGEAVAGEDYEATSGTLTFEPGETEKNIEIAIIGDASYEVDESFSIQLSNPNGVTIGNETGTINILDNDSPPEISIDNLEVVEGEDDPAVNRFTVTLSAPSSLPVTVDYTTVDGEALGGEDYEAISGTLTFEPGETEKTIEISITDDNIDEDTETFNLQLSNPTNATVANDTGGTATISDNDSPPELTIVGSTLTEADTGAGEMVFNLTLSHPSSSPVTVEYTTIDGEAVAGEDYIASSGSVTFAPGETEQTLAITILGDSVDEFDEGFTLQLNNLTNATIANNTAVGTIIDNDEPPTILTETRAVNEESNKIEFAVTLSDASNLPITVDYSTADGTATAGEDYQATEGTLTFEPGETSKTVTVIVNDDSWDEIDESFILNIENATNATISASQITGSILDDDNPPQLTIEDLSVTETDSGTTEAVFTVSLSTASSKEISIDYATVDGTATSGSDYEAQEGTISFNPGETTKTIAVNVNGDILDEIDEAFSLQLTNPVNVTVIDSSAQATINDNDNPPSIDLADVTIAEGNDGIANANFTVTLSNASEKEISLDYTTLDGTAIADEDYLAQDGKLTFAPGETSKTIQITVLSDAIDEWDEAFSIQITNPTNATIVDSTGTGTIIDDDESPSIAIDDITVAEGNDDTTEAVFTVSLSAPSSKEISVDYATSDGTAIAGEDYIASNGTLNFAPGETTKTISVTILGDNLDEIDEAFSLNFNNGSNVVIPDNLATGTISDDDLPPQIALADVSVTEGDNGTSTAVVTVSLSAASSKEISVDYTTSDGTAIAGEDYIASNGTLNFAPGETEKTIEIEVLADLVDEIDEAFSINLSNQSNATISDNEGIVTIVDNDLPPELSIDNLTVAERDSGTVEAIFTVTLSNPSSQEISVDYATADGTAIEGQDYQGNSGTLTFVPGETSKTITINVIGDIVDEIDEAFVVNLNNATNATINNNQGTATISDNDFPPAISVKDVSVNETDVGTVNAVFTITLDNPSSKEIFVDYATTDGTGMSGLDYEAVNGTLTFEPGETEKTIEVGIIGDTVDEPDEFFTLNLSNPNNATIADGEDTATGTIIDDDIPPIALSLALANDTGSVSDNITTDPTINGSIAYIQGEISLNASLDNNAELIDISDFLQPDGSFVLNLEQLQTINGGSFDEGTHVLNLIATDSVTGDVAESELTFTFDLTAPTLSLLTPLPDGDHTATARLVGELSETAEVEYVLDGRDSKTAIVDSENQFDAALSNSELTVGTHSILVTVTDGAGNITETEVNFEVKPEDFSVVRDSWGAKNSETVILGEQDGFVSETSMPIELGQAEGSRTLRFEIASLFDTTDTAPVTEDRLLVYLVDPENPSQTLLDNGEAGTAVFSLAGEDADFTPGLVTFDGQAVEIDLTSLADKTEGLLVFQLLNQDEDTGSIVQAVNFSNTVDVAGSENPLFPDQTIFATAGEEMDLNSLTAVDAIEVQLTNVRFDRDTGKYIAELQVANTGEPVNRQVAVVFPDLPEGVSLTNASGTDEAGNSYINLYNAILPGGLDTGAVSDAVEITFDNPQLLNFGLTPQVLSGGANLAPVFEPIAPIEVMPGSKIAVDLEATDPDNDRVTFLFESEGELPTGTLEGDGKLIFNPAPDEIGSYEFTLIATDGVAETRQNVILDVVADPITTTRISGVIQNVDQQPLAGVPIELGELQTVTAADGSFVIETNEPLTADTLIVRGEELAGDVVYPYIAEKLPLVLGQEVYQGFNNVIDRPIYLPALDIASGQVIDPTVDNIVTTENIPGAAVAVAANTLNNQEGEVFTGILSITEVPADLTPAALPEGVFPDLVVTIQPGEMEFTAPAPLSLPNLAGYEPGEEMGLWSINPVTGDFDNVGTGIVSEDGSVIETVEGGIRNSSWHFFIPWTPQPDNSDDIEENLDEKCSNACQDGKSGNSEVKSHSGALVETHELITYQSNGISRGLTLTYDSVRADPRQIVHFGFSNLRRRSDQYLVGEISVNSGNFTYRTPGVTDSNFSGVTAGQNIWKIPNGASQINAALQVDLSNLPSGIHEYTTNGGIRRLARGRFFGSSAQRSQNEILSVNSIYSPFGSGWGISGWQEIVENRNGSILLVDGNGEEVVFEKNLLGDGSTYISPADDFSTLEKLSNGTFRRTMKDQTVYSFNLQNQLASVIDRNGNETKYEYNNSHQLSTIVDPVGLETYLKYNFNGKVTKIIDPANRETLLQYDTAGNLIGIIDPDNSTRTWEYDSKHHMIAETDKLGNRETTIYNFAGRVVQGTRKDGAEIRVASVQSQGLNRGETTINLETTVEANRSSEGIYSRYADGNGNVIVTRLDRAGQAISAVDGEGNTSSVERDKRNLVEVSTDARGNETRYTYDSQGNVINIVEPLSQVEQLDTTSSIFTQTDFSTGSAPNTLSDIDLNSDGNSDFITFNTNNTFSVLPGNSDGSFQEAQNYTMTGDADASFIADFNGDGNAEIASIGDSGNLAVSFGDEAANFSQSNTYNSLDLNDTTTISFAEANYDNVATNLDFLVDTSQFDFLNLVSISGNKPFKQPDYIPVGEPQPTTIFAQLNADNIEDRVSLNDDETFSVEIGNSDGSFAPATNYDFNLDYIGGNGEYVDGSALITAGDIDNDGIDDILVAFQKVIFDQTQPLESQETVNSYLNIFRGQGDGTVLLPSYYSNLFSEPYDYPESFVLKDIENDGILDWIVFDRDNLEVRPIRYDPDTGRLFWFTQRLNTDPQYLVVSDFVDRYISQDVIATDATQTQLELVSYFTRNNDFDIFRVYDEDSRASIRRSTHTLTNSSDYVAVEDLDGDNRYDWITVAEDRSSVTVSLKNSDGSNKSENSIIFDTIPSSVNMGDLDEDGNYDLLAVYEESGDFFAYFGNGDGTFADPVTYNLPGEYDTPILRDLDNDGDEDLIAVASDESGNKTFSVFLDDGSGNYGSPFSYTFSGNPNSFVLKDLDNDGDEDLVAVNSLSKRLNVVTNSNNTGFANEASYDLSDFDYLSFQDLDADGDLDLLTTTDNQQSYFLLFNQGDASFGNAAEFNFDNSVQRLAFQDLDGDSNLDLVGTFDVAQEELFIALGQADGSYSATTTYSFSRTPDRLSFQDVDDNGVKDLIATNLAQQEVEVFLTTETATNGVVSNSTTKNTYTTAIDPQQVSFYDLDSDLDLDLVVTNSDRTAYSIRLNDGSGIYGEEYTTTTNLATAPIYLTLTDIDNSNGLDLLAANADKTQYSLLLNNGDRTWGEAIDFDFQTSLESQTWSDFNFDGNLDLVSTNEERSAISVFLGQDDGSFNEEIVYDLTSSPTHIALGDLDGNNTPDLIGIDEAQTQVTTVLSNSDGTLQPEVNYTPGIESQDTLTVDLDGDGDNDSVVVNSDRDTVSVSLNRGDNTFEPTIEYVAGFKPIGLVARDFNGDGNLDLAIANQYSRNISLLYGVGRGMFANAILSEEDATLNGSSRPYDTVVVDVNQDTYLDLITLNFNHDRVDVLLGAEDGSFADSTSTYFQVGDGPYALAVEDVDRDNLPDLITSNRGPNTISVLKGMGNGLFGERVDYAAGINPNSITIEDLNADGIKDLITTNNGQQTVSVLWGLEDGSYSSPTSYNSNARNPNSVAIDDFNSDDIPDMVLSGDGRLSILLGTEDGSFVYSTSYYLGNSVNDVATYDLNSDGLVDLIGTSSGRVNFLYGQEDGSFNQKGSDYLGNFAPISLEIADFNGDNVPEIAALGDRDVALVKHNGDETITTQGVWRVNDGSNSIAVGDLVTDGLTDLTALSYSWDGKSLQVTKVDSYLLPEQNYTYDPTFNQVTSYIDENGNRTFYDIDPETGNNLATTKVVGSIGGDNDVTTSYTYTDAGLVDTMTDAEGRVTDYEYDVYGRLIQETSAVGTADETVVRYEYDAAGNQTAMIDAAGNRIEYEYDALNRVTKITEADPDREGELTAPVSTFTYDGAGNLIETVDANDNVTTNEYDKQNRLVHTTNAKGETTEFEYDGAGNITQVTDAEGRTSQNIYDSRNRLTEIIDPLGNGTKYEYDADDNLTATIDPLGNKTQYVYDQRSRMIQEIDAEENITQYEYDVSDNLIAIIDANGNRSEFEYDQLDRQVAQINPLGEVFTTAYDEVGNLISTTDDAGRTTQLAYDPLNRLTSTTNALDGVISYQYDGVGNLTSVTDEENRTTNFTYDALNRQTSVIDPLTYTTNYQYDAVGNLTAITDANDYTTGFTYDKLNRQTVITNHLGDTIETEYDQVGNVIAFTDELGRTTEFGYDERDRQTSVTNALGYVTTNQYDAAGNLIELTDARGNTTNYEYDKLYRLISEIDANNEDVSYQYDAVGNLLGFTDELDRTTTYGYDALNRQISVSDPLLHTTTTQYDKVGNLISVTDANDHTTNFTYDKLNRQTVITNHLGDTIETEYDQVGNVTAITDELDRTTRFTYDERNFQTSITDPLTHTSTTQYDKIGNVISITDPLNHTTTYAYDELYRLTSQTDAENRTTSYNYDPTGNLLSLTDPEQNTTSYSYDDLNRLVTDTNQLGDTRSYQYDEVGNQIGSIDRNGREINYTYDPLNRNTAEIWLDESGNPIRTFNFQYDAASQLVNANDPDSAYAYQYDLDGRLTEVDNAGTPGVPNVVFNYTYDPVDNLTNVTDSIDGIERGIETFAYDELDRVTSITQSGDGVSEKRVDYSYDAASQMSQVERYQDLAGTNKISESNYKFDEAGRLTELNHLKDEEVISAYDWAYDAANRITQATSPDGVSDYNYDQTDQLVDAEYDYQDNENYSYDDNGNRTNDGYVTEDNNQLLSDGTYNYEYDAEGNRVSRVEIATGEVTEYSWDYRNRLVEVVTSDSDGNVISDSDYTYDVFDRRIAKSVDADGDGAGEAVTERFVYDGDHIALTFDGEGNQTERFLHGARIDEIIAQENADGEVLWALADHQGSIRVLLDNDGNVVNEITYDAFGNITVESNSDINFRFSYTGRELDSETGNYYYRSRYYDPAIGQFINEDTIGFAGRDSNLYRYVVNSPVNYIDPDGEEVITLTTLATIAAVVGISGALAYYTNQLRGQVEEIAPQVAEELRELGRQFQRELERRKTPKKPPFFPPLIDQDDVDDLQDKFKDWFEKMKELIEDVTEDNEKKEEEQEQNNDNGSGGSCGPGDRPDFLDDLDIVNEAQNSGDEPTEGGNDNGDDNQPEGNSKRSEEDFRPENPEHPANSDIKELYESPKFQKLIEDDCYDCSEIAEDIRNLTNNGDILRVTPKNPQESLKVPEVKNGELKIQEFDYHEVYTDGSYVYDPRLSSSPIPKGDFDRIMKRLNPNGLKTRKLP